MVGGETRLRIGLCPWGAEKPPEAVTRIKAEAEVCSGISLEWWGISDYWVGDYRVRAGQGGLLGGSHPGLVRMGPGEPGMEAAL